MILCFYTNKMARFMVCLVLLVPAILVVPRDLGGHLAQFAKTSCTIDIPAAAIIEARKRLEAS